ncbi:DUF262 domain-containing protein [Deinococcus hopiensis]|uniref:GmrSD restriction endonucleases N-terminal domain-containing protein n=1 Tax=Deinococcus hopiensis KR-140 TaxID=695939 RepID=A0A1W1U9M1_9DEIO|nr:DUF262 domain-containing protein [Deinococcus hopiensis]SMB77788.1 hypothetical protein SAMN00790413_03917 [Deinococcus hopiensis KR-140]
MTTAHENANSESLKNLVDQLEHKPPVVLLPEFQRDFVWDLQQTYDLFDSLIRGIFVGSVIYGKPSFEMTLREVDMRPRKGKGSREKPKRKHYTEVEMVQASQMRGLKILLDGQQRTTSIYRALRGIDKVYFRLRPDWGDATILKDKSLEELLGEIVGDDSAEQLSVPLDYAFSFMKDLPMDDEVRDYFEGQTAYGVALIAKGDAEANKQGFRIFLQLLHKFRTMFEQPQLLSYYLLDMNLDKFTTFFERSNSKGVQLNFTDILAAKVFGSFNLREKFEEFADQYPHLPNNRELMVRGVALLKGVDKIDKGPLLKELRAQDFLAHWDEMTDLLVKTVEFLKSQRLIVAIKWLPYDNLLLPLMMFFRELKAQGQSAPSQEQWELLRWWYWSVVFSERYSAATNDKIVQDAHALQQVARREPPEAAAFARLRPTLDVSDLFSYNRSSSAVYRGVLNLLHFNAEGMKTQGLRDWRSNALLGTGVEAVKDLHDHHFFPRAFLRKTAKQQDDSDPESIMDSVLNRVLMPKDANFSASDKQPFVYLNEFLNGTSKIGKNSNLRQSMSSHLVPESLLIDEQQSFRVEATLRARAEQILQLIEAETTKAEVPLLRALLPRSTALEGS